MDEDALWKYHYDKLTKQKSQEETDHDLRLQEIDGGFFEKFGTQLKQQVSRSDEEPPVPEEPEQPDEPPPEPQTEDVISDVIGLNGSRGKISKLKGVKIDELRRQTSILIQSMTIEELYTEILYEVIHIVGSDASSEEQEKLFEHLKEAFKIDDDKHAELLKSAQDKEAPKILLNVEVIEARELAAKDANGLSDPFCTLYLTSTSSHRYNTSVQAETLSPTWEEHFSLPVVSANEDTLCLEVWDFDPAETVKEKMTKISGVKGIKGLRKLMREIAVTASTGKHDNELIGTALIPLKSIPAAGHTKWYTLERRAKAKSQGAVKLKMMFSSQKNVEVAAQEHRHLLRLLLLHDLEVNKTDPADWDGEFTGASAIILRQHAAQSGLRPWDEDLSRWIEFSRLHTNHPLNFKLFSSIIKDISDPLVQKCFSDDEIKLFWEAAKKVLPSMFNYVKKLRKFAVGDKDSVEQIFSILVVLSGLLKIDMPPDFELFPSSLYQSLPPVTPVTIDKVLEHTVRHAVLDWFAQIIESNKPTEPGYEASLAQAVKVIQLIKGDIQKSVAVNELFITALKISYSKMLFSVYDTKICDLVEPLVAEICSAMKPLKIKDEVSADAAENDSLAMGTSLFELYLALQKLLALCAEVFPTEGFQVSNFHMWFRTGVAHWLSIAVFKALRRINKAVELDTLKPYDPEVKYSSSAVDTLSIFYQIKTFWEQLNWPDIEGAYTFVAKILDDICRCSVHYADRMSLKVDNLGVSDTVYGKKFEVTSEWCLAINNIDHIRQSIRPFVKDLNVQTLFEKLARTTTEVAAENCMNTIDLVIDNTLDTVQNKLIDLLEAVARKMEPVIKRYLLERTELSHSDNNHVERLMQYLDDNLITLGAELSTENFERVLSIIWEKVAIILNDLIADGLEKRRPPSFFACLNQTLDDLIGFFRQSENAECNQMIKDIRHILNLHGMDTEQLILQYYYERLNEQKQLENPIFGMLTVRMQFIRGDLKIEIMNARSLPPHDSNGGCDPYVKIHLLPEEKFSHINKPRTKTHKKNLFPLFDETFVLGIGPSLKETFNDQAMVHLIVKDQDFLGMSSQFVGEAFVPFKDIPSTNIDNNIHSLPQIHLKLTKPTSTDTEIYRALDRRHGEKQARDFIKRQKTKMAHVNGNS